MYQKVINTILVLVACQGINIAQPFPFDTSKSSYFWGNIIIDCVPLIDNVPITENDYILVYQDDTIIGYKRYNNYDSSIIIPTYCDRKTDSAISYGIYRMSGDTCLLTNITTDKDSITTEIDTREIITNMIAFSEYIYYPKDTICTNDTIAPILPTGIDVYDVYFSSNTGLNVDQMGNIYPSENEVWEGVHELKIDSKYCLRNKSIEITIVEPLNITEIYNLTLCQNEPLIENIKYDTVFSQNYWIDTTNSIIDSLDDRINKKHTIFTMDINGCRIQQELNVDYLLPASIDVNQEFLCNKTLLSIIEPSLLDTFDWSNGETNETIEIYNDTSIKLNIVDKNGCSNSITYDVTIKPLEIISLDYSVEESSCWEFGKINLISNTNKYGYTPYSYILTNTLNNQQVNDISRVPEGIYILSVVDSRNCRADYEKEIVVMQDCLNNYPVFTPNEDGNEDEYFISYEGNVTVYDRNGRILTKLETPAYWDGKDNRGNIVPMGNYVMITDKGKAINITVIR